MHGECICGEVAFEINGVLPKAYQCHCSLCRKQSGSASNTGLMIAEKNFHWLKGEDNVSFFEKDTGFRSNFCSKCGSVVPNAFRDQPYVWVPVGSLDDSEPLEVAIQICVGSKASWDIVPSDVEQMDGMPPSLAEFLAFLHAK